MSDLAIRVIPTDREWQPSPVAAEALVGFVAGLFAVPGAAVERVEARFYDTTTVIDSGENTELVICPRCGVETDEPLISGGGRSPRPWCSRR
jgi:hypothetical protein